MQTDTAYNDTCDVHPAALASSRGMLDFSAHFCCTGQSMELERGAMMYRSGNDRHCLKYAKEASV